MKRVIFLAPVALAALAGCAPKPNQIQAGQWEVTTELTEVSLPNATPEQQAQIQRQVGQAQPQPPQCITAEQARTIVEDIRRAPPNCTVSDEVYAGGVMRTKLTCPPQGAGQPGITMTLNGSFTNTTFNATITEEATGGGSAGTMRRSQRLRGRRVGECPATPAAPALPAPPPGTPNPHSAPPPAPPAGNSAAPGNSA